ITLAILATIISILNILPPFFIQGVGSTASRQIIVIISALLFLISGVTIIRQYQKTGFIMFYWLALGLMLIFLVMITNLLFISTGTPLSWVLRISQLLGGVYLLMAALVILKEAKIQQISADEALTSFFQGRKQNLNLLFDSITDAIIVTDQNNIITGWSRGAEEIYGWKAEEAIGKTNKFLNTNSPNYSQEDVTKQIIENGSWSGEIGQITKDGKLISVWTFASIIKDESGKTIGIMSANNDITEHKKAEEELRQARNHLEEQVEERTSELEKAYKTLKASELKFKTLTENSVDIIDRQDRQFRHLFVNNIIYKLLKIPPESFIGKTNRELGMSEELVNLWESKTQEVFNTGKIGHMEFELPTQNGINYYQSILVPEYNPNNKIESVLIISRDITERKQAEEQLKEIITELERSNKELQSFAYITSHDLQEPLRSIASYAQLLKRRYKGQLDSDADDFIEYMVSGATRLQDMIKGLLDYSRVGTQGEEFKEFDSEDALNNTLSNLKSSIEECNAEVTHDKLPVITADESQITRVFQNLMGNALKFRKEGIMP
ncbi:MAG: PAS domain S-box protein, partial [Methanobacterium sp.]